jgi:hypothetical protein
MRIIAGKARGTRLESPAGAAIRPTGDRVRESVFNILEHAIAGFRLTGARVLDLFAGSGALGLEALSRGAGFCVFIDIDAAARGLVRLNVERTHMTGHSRISRRDAADPGPIGRPALWQASRHRRRARAGRGRLAQPGRGRGGRRGRWCRFRLAGRPCGDRGAPLWRHGGAHRPRRVSGSRPACKRRQRATSYLRSNSRSRSASDSAM